MADKIYTRAAELVTAYDRQLSALSTKHVDTAWAMWSTLTPSDWWNDGVTYGYASRLAYQDMLRVTKARGFGQAASSQLLSLMGGTRPEAFTPGWMPTRANTDPWRIQLKPVEQYRHEAMQSPDIKPLAWPQPTEQDWQLVNEWLDTARQRLETVSDADTTRAGDDGSRETYQHAGVTHYRRLIHPELSKTGTCGLCAVAATQIYKISDPKPMHDHCHCTVMPILDGDDPGEYMNNLDLNMLYRKAGGTDGQGLRKLRVQVSEHGELGPVLTEQGTVAKDTSYKADSPTQRFNQTHYRQPDRDTARQELEDMLERSEQLMKTMRSVQENGRPDTLTLQDHVLNIRPSKNLKRAIQYQTEFARQLRSMLGMAA